MVSLSSLSVGEKTAHKLAHRGLFMRSAGGGPTKRCRRGCGHIESQQHLADCRYYQPFWDEIIRLVFVFTGLPPQHDTTRATVLGIWEEDLTLAPPPALAVLRIAVRMLYATITEATENESVFVCLSGSRPSS